MISPRRPTRRRFGRYDVLLLRDGVFEPSVDMLTHADGEMARLRVVERWGWRRMRLDVNCFALLGPEGVMLVDAGAGNTWGTAYGAARNGLAAAGIEPEDVVRVLLTHLHGDHGLGLFAGESAYYPNAEVLLPRGDFAYFNDPAGHAAAPQARRGGYELTEKLIDVYQGRLSSTEPGPLMEGIEARALPGHTPGHTGYLIGEGDDKLLIWGDILHVDSLQAGDPKIGTRFDLDPVSALATRAETLEAAAREGWTIAGGHVHGFGRVERDGAAYRIVPA